MATILAWANLNLGEEVIGPLTNQKTVQPLHPDMHSSDLSAARTSIANRAKNRSTWLPNLLRNNIKLQQVDPADLVTSGEYIVKTGLDAEYIKKQYAKQVSPAAAAPDPMPPLDAQTLNIIQA